MHPLDPISRKTWFSAENPVIGMGSQENPVFQSIPTYFKVLVGQGILTYIWITPDRDDRVGPDPRLRCSLEHGLPGHVPRPAVG